MAIVLFGATGYTGDLTARALVARGGRPVLAARNAERLTALASELGGLETRVADVERPETVRDAVGAGDVMLTTVGPFARWGAPAVEAAIAAGVPYLDSTGEPPFIRDVFETHGPRAAAAGSPMLTAMGYDWVPGNLAGALALRDAGEAATRVELGYFFTGRAGMSGGTRASSAGVMAVPSFAWRDGRLAKERGFARTRSFTVGGKELQAGTAGGTEHFTLPAVHPQLRDVDVYLGWFGPATAKVARTSAIMSALGHVPGFRAGLGAFMSRTVKGSTGGPDAAERAKSDSVVVAEAKDAGGEVLSRVEVRGANGYDFTAGMLAWAAERAAAGEIRGAGALGPVEAFGLDALEAGAAEAGISRVA